MKNKKLSIIYIIFIFIVLLSFRIIFQLRQDTIPGHNWDWTFPNIEFLFENIYILSNYTWWEFNLGMPLNLTISQLIPNIFLVFLSHLFGVKIAILTLLILVITISFLSHKKLLDFVICQTNKNYIPSFLYAFSPFLFCEIIGGSWYMWISYAFAPLLFLNLLKYINTKSIKYLIGFLLSAVFVISSLQNFVLIETIIILFLLYNILVKKQEFKKILFRYSFVHAILIIFNLYWILPFIGSFMSFYQSVLKNPSFEGGFQAVRTSTQSIPNILMLTGYLDRNMYYHALPDFIVPLFIISVFSIWVLIALPVIFKKQSLEYNALPWLLILLLMIILIKGGNPPFGSFTMWFYNILPLMKLYRSPQHLMFAAAFIIPILIAYSLHYIYKKSKYKKTILTIFSLCIFIWISGWWYNGDLGHEVLKNKRRDYIDFYALSPGLEKTYQRNEKSLIDHRILFLPAVFSPQYLKTKYQNRANGGQPEYMYLKNPTFTSESNPFANELETSFCKGIEFNYINYLRLFSVKDIFLRYDIYPHFTESATSWDSHKVKVILDSSSSLNKFLEEKYVNGYSIKSDYFLPHIYPASTTTLVSNNIK